MLPRLQLGKVVRENFLVELFPAMEAVGAAVQTRLTEALDESGSLREAQMRRDLWTTYKTTRAVWVEKTCKEWRASYRQTEPQPFKATTTASAADLSGLSLIETDVVENRILASRLALAVNDKVLPEFDDVRVRLKALEGLEDLDAKDIIRTEALVRVIVQQWAEVGMPPEMWPVVNGAVEATLVSRLMQAYRNANALLVSKGVLPTIALKDRVRVQPRNSTAPRDSARAGLDARPTGASDLSSRNGPASVPPKSTNRPPITGGAQPFWRSSNSERHGLGGTAEETRMLTAATPLARARSRAQGVIGQIRRLFTSSVGSDFAQTVQVPPSPALVQALAPEVVGQAYATGGTLYQDFTPRGVARVADDLRERSSALKQKAETKAEKAIIEIVALMFQAILAEERIPPGIRVWFARLQMPVLRVALEDSDFLGSAEHPARALIDRMGSCVMGFDASGVQGAAMEAEIKRVVQVIEQYPETGRKVYQIVYDEFQKFLGKFLTEKGVTPKVISVAQQVEQKETLAIQYTIEMRNMLKDLPVREEIRDYLFKVWAEVLAVCALRKGSRHAETVALKTCATDLVWAASAKPNRADRTRVIQDLPNLLVRLRSGMSLLGMPPSEQEHHVKVISDTLADAFLSKTQAIPQAQIDAMAKRLAGLEDFVSEDGMGDIPLDSESLEMMLGIDASSIQVVASGGSRPTAAMQAWAAELQLGAWFTLDYNQQTLAVQLAWRSDRKHLNLFAATSGTSFLLQGGRLAGYLQAGLLVPQEEESLTVRATRDALAKLEANPERLLS